MHPRLSDCERDLDSARSVRFGLLGGTEQFSAHDLVEPALLGRSENSAHFEYVRNRFVLQFAHRVVETVNSALHARAIGLVFENGGGDISCGRAHFSFERLSVGAEARFDCLDLAVLLRAEIKFAMHGRVKRAVSSFAVIGEEGKACINAERSSRACDERSDERGAPDCGHIGQSPRIVDSASGARMGNAVASGAV